MIKKLPKIVFFGSGPVAAKSLELLLPSFDIEAVITKPRTADEMKGVVPKTPIYATSDRNELDQLLASQDFKSTVAILIDFGIIVSQTVIDHFSGGIINSHFSLLPQLRGADPITFAILNGQKQTGVSLMLLVEKMDEGPLLAQAIYAIPDGATTPELTSALIELSIAELKTIIPLYLKGEIAQVSQDQGNITGDKKPSYSRKLTKEDSIMVWTKPALQLEREIRAFLEWPKSRTTLANREIIVTQAAVSNKHGQPPGSVSVEGQQLYVYCGDKSLEIKRLKPAGKPEMSAAAFLAGYRQLLY
jgi:methionyl-tRNA formyltransferase